MPATILIVDDSPTILTSLEMTLTMHDIDVVSATSAEEALETLRGGVKPNMIFTDLNMGAMNGIELIRNVRKMSGFQFVPIVLLTTESQPEKKQEAKAAGATGWLNKPANAEAVMKVVGQILKI